MDIILNGMKMVKKEEKCDYVNGKYNGHCIKWHANGQIYEECNYINDKKLINLVLISIIFILYLFT